MVDSKEQTWIMRETRACLSSNGEDISDKGVMRGTPHYTITTDQPSITILPPLSQYVSMLFLCSSRSVHNRTLLSRSLPSPPSPPLSLPRDPFGTVAMENREGFGRLVSHNSPLSPSRQHWNKEREGKKEEEDEYEGRILVDSSPCLRWNMWRMMRRLRR